MPEKKFCSCKTVIELVLVLLTTLTYAAKVAVCVYGWWGEPSRIALQLSLYSAFEKYALPISPPPWTQLLWLLLFLWEAMWILFSWVLLFKPHAPRLVYPGFYLGFSVVCLLHTGWVFAWARQVPEPSLALVGLQTILLFLCIAVLTAYLYFIRGTFKFYYSCNFWTTRLLVLNGTAAYATFSFLLTLFNIGAVLSKNAELDVRTSSTILLSALSSTIVTYFLLENTILDRFLRYIFAVYPVVLWILVGVLTETWQGAESLGERNQLFVLVLACVVGVLILTRVVLWVVFICTRPLPDYEKNEVDVLPQ